MIIDAHTHVFPDAVVAERDAFLQRDPTFAAMYSSPKARVATAEALAGSMDVAGIDASVALGFGWSDADLCALGNDALLEGAARFGARIMPFATVWPGDPDAAYREAERCAGAGARGLGELRPGQLPAGQGYTLDGAAGDALAAAARDFELTLLFHVSEPVGHLYPGKEGLRPEELLAFVERYPDVRVIAAHWGGGLPFYALMPEVSAALKCTWFDTAASPLLYDDRVFATGGAAAGVDRVLFGSDFPLLPQKRQRRVVEEAPGLTPEAIAAILGGNAAALLGLDAPDAGT